MADARIRELELRWQRTGSVQSEAALLAARVRAGLDRVEGLRLRAFLGEPGARVALGMAPEPCQVKPEGGLAAMLGRFEQLGGVVDHLFFASAGLQGRAGHELIARETVRLLSVRDGLGEAEARKPEATDGWSMGLAGFFGCRFDFEAQRLLFSGPGGLFPPEEAGAARAAAAGWGDSIDDGYAFAFSAPPYTMRPFAEVERVFFDLWEQMVGSMNPAEVEIYGWETEALTWFDDGREWWGAFLWTVRPPGAAACGRT